MTRVAVIGAAGRMGTQTCRAIEDADDLTLVSRIDFGDDLVAGLGGVQVAVIFSVPDVALEHVLACIERGVHAVVGTSGWTAEKLDVVQSALRQAPHVGVLVAPNF